MRILLAANLASRNGLLTKDAKIVNAIVEMAGEQSAVRKRSGLRSIGLIAAGTAQLLYWWNGLRIIIGDIFYTTGSTTAVFTPTVAATWTTRTLPVGATWACMAYGGGRYVAIALSGAVAISTNGTTWTSGTSITARTWGGIAWNGTVFCAVAQDSSFTAVSSDGLTWDQSGQVSAFATYSVASNGVIFVCEGSAGSSTQNVLTSPDGITWTTRVGVLPASRGWRYLGYNGTVFILTDPNPGGAAATSFDGITWTARTLSTTATSRGGLAAGGGIIVSIPISSSIASYSLDNGVTWANCTLSFSAVSETRAAYNGSVFVITTTTGAASLSANGIDWAATTLFSPGLYSIAVASDGTNFAAAAFSSSTLSSSSAITTTILTASSNLSPTTAGLPFSAQDSGSNAVTSRLMIKNATQGWTVNTAGTPSLITDVDYPSSYTVNVVSLTRSGTTATATMVTTPNFKVGDTVTIAGATPSAYNGAQVITSLTASILTVNPTQGVSTVTRATTTATVTFPSPHGYSTSDRITIAGAAETAYNGAFTITVLTPTTLTYPVPLSTSFASSALTVATPATGGTIALPFEFFAAGGAWNDFTNFTLFTGITSVNVPVASTFTTLTSVPGFPAGTYTVTANLAVNNGMFSGPAYYLSFTVAACTVLVGFSRVDATTAPPSIVSITQLNGTATVTTSGAHLLSLSQVVIISGASPNDYNGRWIVTVTGATTFTYSLAAGSITQVATTAPATPATGTITATLVGTSSTPVFTFTIAGSPATPATGTITALGSRTTAPGIAYLNGYFCVIDTSGVIYNSALDDPSQWFALDYTTAQAETGAGRAIAKSQNYLIGLKEWSTEPFYDAANVVGSPFSPVPNGQTLVGCASGFSLCELDGALMFMSQVKAQGRSVHMMQGLQQVKVSTPDVERVLNLDSLATIRAYGVKLDGHSLYVLSLVASNVTLVYDIGAQSWTQWTSLTAASNVSVTSITQTGGLATVTTPAPHGLSDGDPVTISGASPSGYNLTVPIARLSTTTFSYPVSSALASPATGTILVTPYTESYFKFPYYANANSTNVVIHETNGFLYTISSTAHQDAGLPINVFTRTTRLDGGSTDSKALGQIQVIGDSVSDIIGIRYSDDDSSTFSAYRFATLSRERPMIRRCGSFRRRTIETRFIGNNPLQLSTLETK